MEIMPIEFSSSDRTWAQECMERLRFALTNLDGNSGSSDELAKILWVAPESPVAALLLADQMLAFEIDSDRLEDNPSYRAVLETAYTRLAGMLFDAIQSMDPQWEEEGVRLVHALAGQRAASLYSRSRACGLRRSQGQLLQVLLANRVASAVSLGVDLLVDQPPTHWSDASLAISALVQSNRWKIEDVFPKILQSTAPSVLAPAIDLANMLVRERGVSPHPGAERFDALLTLLGSMNQQLALLEEDPSRYSSDIQEVQRMLFDGVSLTVSLCHFFALQGDPRAVAKLTQTLDLGHRRIKAEAAYALAKLGEARAADLLVELLEDDASRWRVQAYLKELGLEHRVDAKWTTQEANAKSQLALWLSQPEQFAIPPTKMECVDHRTMPWPGFDEPQECYLIRFEYDLGSNVYQNIGFAGPYAHAFGWDLSPLEASDQYGMFLANDIDDSHETREAWNAESREHQQIFEAWSEALREQGYSEIVPLAVFRFVGMQSLLVRANNAEGRPMVLIYDGQERMEHPASKHAEGFLFVRWKGRCAMELIGQ